MNTFAGTTSASGTSVHPALNEVFTVQRGAQTVSLMHPGDVTTQGTGGIHVAPTTPNTSQAASTGVPTVASSAPNAGVSSAGDDSVSPPAAGGMVTSPSAGQPITASNLWGALMIFVVAIIFISMFHNESK